MWAAMRLNCLRNMNNFGESVRPVDKYTLAPVLSTALSDGADQLAIIH